MKSMNGKWMGTTTKKTNLKEDFLKLIEKITQERAAGKEGPPVALSFDDGLLVGGGDEAVDAEHVEAGEKEELEGEKVPALDGGLWQDAALVEEPDDEDHEQEDDAGEGRGDDGRRPADGRAHHDQDAPQRVGSARENHQTGASRGDPAHKVEEAVAVGEVQGRRRDQEEQHEHDPAHLEHHEGVRALPRQAVGPQRYRQKGHDRRRDLEQHPEPDHPDGLLPPPLLLLLHPHPSRRFSLIFPHRGSSSTFHHTKNKNKKIV